MESENVGLYEGRKTLGARETTSNKLNPHMVSTLGIKPEPHWWKASVLTIGPSMSPFMLPAKGAKCLFIFVRKEGQINKNEQYAQTLQELERGSPPDAILGSELLQTHEKSVQVFQENERLGLNLIF